MHHIVLLAHCNEGLSH